MAQITASGQNTLSEINGMVSVNLASKSEVTGLSTSTFTTTATGVNKGVIELELINSVGTTVKSVSNHYDSDLSVVLTPTDSSSGDNSSTSTQIKWLVNIADFTSGKIKMTTSGKIQDQQMTADGLSGDVTGNGHSVVTFPFSVTVNGTGNQG